MKDNMTEPTTPQAAVQEAPRLAQQLKSICRRRDDIRCGLLTARACEKIEAERDALIDSLAALAQQRLEPAAVERDWGSTCDECCGTGKVDVSEALHVDGRYMGENLMREACNACAGYGFTVCLADIPKEIQR